MTRNSCAQSSRRRLCVPDNKRRLMVFAIDDVCSLIRAAGGPDWCSVIKQALCAASHTIADRFGASSVLMAVIVESPSMVSPFVVPGCSQPKTFKPFVLPLPDGSILATRIPRDQAACVEDVTTAVQMRLDMTNEVWRRFGETGRPLLNALSRKLDRNECLDIIAKELMLDATATTAHANAADHATCEKKLHPSVAHALLHARVGSRDYRNQLFARERGPHPLATVVSLAGTQAIVRYPSEPLAATNVVRYWSENDGRGKSILPSYINTIGSDTIDIGKIGELMGRVLLLISMDACAELEGSLREHRWSHSGDFRSTWTWVRTPVGDNPDLVVPDTARVNQKARLRVTRSTVEKTTRSSAEKTTQSSGVKRKWSVLENETSHLERENEFVTLRSHLVDAPPEAARAVADILRQQRESTFVNFAHFVYLDSHPDVVCLWQLLWCGAAGIMPSGAKGIDFVIPVYVLKTSTAPARISAIVTRIKNQANGDPAFPKTATTRTHPDAVFRDPELKKLKHSRRFILREVHNQTSKSGGVDYYALCTQGIRGWSEEIEVACDRVLCPKSPVTIFHKSLTAPPRPRTRAKCSSTATQQIQPPPVRPHKGPNTARKMENKTTTTKIQVAGVQSEDSKRKVVTVASDVVLDQLGLLLEGT